MAIEQVNVQAQPLPFVIESVSPARIKLWGKLAAQVTSEYGFRLVHSVYSRFWSEEVAVQAYQHALSWVEAAAAGDINAASQLLLWVDHVAFWLTVMMNEGVEIQQHLLPKVGDIVSARHVQDISQSVTMAVHLLAEVRQFGMAVCQEFGLAVPQYLVEEQASPTVPAVGEGLESF